jgi:hypothetical protein
MKLLPTTVLALLILLATPARADISRDEAAAVAQRMTDSRVLSVETAESNRRPVWRVKILTDKSEVRVILIDAASGLSSTRNWPHASRPAAAITEGTQHGRREEAP